MEIPKRPAPKLVSSPVPVTVVVRPEQKDGAPPAPQYRGTWRRGESYAVSDCVTYGGSMWIATGEAGDGAAPGQSRTWRLAVKRGDPGREGDVGPMPRHEWRGTEIRFEQGPDGERWGPWVDLKGPPGRDGVGGGVIVQQTGAGTGFGYFPGGWA